MEPRGCNPWQISRKFDGLKDRRNTREPLPWVATGCLEQRMVRGSPVRVRKRPLQKRRKRGFFVCVQSAQGALRAWMEPFMELSRREPRQRRLDVLVRLAGVAYPA
jgi:hypothetical protein